MQIKLRFLPVATLALLTTITACKKEVTKSDNATEVATHNDDQNSVSNEMDAVATEASAALESSTSFSGRMMDPQNTNDICGATTVADTAGNPRKITITYNGNDCSGTHYRTGSVVLSMAAGTRWKNAGATVTVSFQNLKIKRLSDNKSITINGTHTLTNQSGGLLISLPNLGTITHTIASSNMSITFDNGAQRTWQVAKKRVYTYNNGIVLSITGTHTEGSNTQVAEWGTNRFGHAFTTSITSPLVFRQDCLYRLTSGAIKHEGFATATATFGLNASGQPTGCPGTGRYYMQLSWTGPNGNTFSTILPY